MIDIRRYYVQRAGKPIYGLLALGAGFCVLVFAWSWGGLMLPSGAVNHASGDHHPVTAVSWTQTAQRYRGQSGDVVLYCPHNGQLGNVWGSDVYADDSSICTAAVHGGLITVEDGGAIAIRILPGQSTYVSTTQNTVTSEAWGAWFGSFTFTTLHDPIASIIEVEGQSVPLQVASWQTTAAQFSDRKGDVMALYCPPNGQLGLVWGSDIYRDASSVCSAAVHDGQLTVEEGGAIAFSMQPGQTHYQGLTRQGMTSLSFGETDSSFQFVPL